MGRNENNQVMVEGEIAGRFEPSCDGWWKGAYGIYLSIMRDSGVTDTLPVIVPGKTARLDDGCIGRTVCIHGSLRSRNRQEKDKRRLVLEILADGLEWPGEPPSDGSMNSIHLDGFICKAPIYRKTPLGRDICDMMLAVNRAHGKSDYIPCIAWGRNARFASSLLVGDRVAIDGRIQSREYRKQIGDGIYEKRTVYEVSCREISQVVEVD